MEKRPAQSRLLVRLALVIEDSKLPLLPPRRCRRETLPRDRPGGWKVLKDQPAANQEQAEAMPEDRWKELETLNARFDAELAYADSCLEEEPPPSDMEMLLASASELYGGIGLAIVTLGWFFIIGRVVVVAMTVNAVVYDRFGSISSVVFGLPLIRYLPRRWPWFRDQFQLEEKRDD